jgi:hypothetical protein
MRPHRRRRARFAVALPLLFALLGGSTRAAAQHTGHEGMPAALADTGSTLHLMAQAIPLVTHADHTPGGRGRTEAALSQALLMARAGWWRGRAALDVTLDAEGITMPGGELGLGAFGEGFADRRHPHTYLHELMLGGLAHAGQAAFSISAGRGFAPFGTDDPMVRPLARYPINHHLAQILERGLVSAAARLGPAIVEVGTFTGEEPQHPSSLPLARRFGDSWSVRGTALPASWAELQASYARVSSPEMPSGFGLDQRKRSLSVRAVSADAARYALAEWARTVERDHSRGEDAFAYESALAEGSLRAGPLGIAIRLEQTERPEEERLADPFRVARPASDLHIIGITRWRTASLRLETPRVTWGTVGGVSFVELSRLAASARDSRSLFTPDAFYGGTRFWMVTAGVRLRAGAAHDRMGRYGAARP